MKRVAVSDKNENLQLVLRTLEACNAMLTCTSIQHNKPAGCPICGGIESARGLHVISVHRTSGEKTLLSWDIEMQNLAKEQEVCENELNAVKEELKVLRPPVNNTEEPDEVARSAVIRRLTILVAARWGAALQEGINGMPEGEKKRKAHTRPKRSA